MNPKPAAASTVLSALATAAAVHAGATPTVIYVDASAPAGGDGTSWQTAFRELQDGLDLASRECLYGVIDLRVAQGVYKPGRGHAQRSDSFRLEVPSVTSAAALTLKLDGLGRLGTLARAHATQSPVLTSAPTIYFTGSFAGLAAGDFSPDWHYVGATPTVLTGDLSSNDSDAPLGGLDDNSFVVVQANVGPRGVLVVNDMIVERAASYQQDAHGMTVSCWTDGVARFSNCIFRKNRGSGSVGAGLFVYGRYAAFDWCTFEDNTTHLGANTGPGGGLAISWYGIETGQAYFRSCKFLRNTAASGAGCYIDAGYHNASFDYCAFRDNHAEESFWGGGAAAVDYGWFSQCHFEGNSTAGRGGAVLAGDIEDWGSSYLNNQGRLGGAIAAYGNLWLTISSFTGNRASEAGGAISATGNFQSIRRAQFVGNSVEGPDNARGGAISMTGESCEVRSCQFFGNRALSSDGSALGGAVCAQKGVIVSSAFSGNSAEGRTSGLGGAVAMLSGGAVLYSTVAFNRASASQGPGLVGGIATGFGELAMDASVLWGNSDMTGINPTSQVSGLVPGFATHPTACAISGLPNAPDSSANFGRDPLFMNPAGPDGIIGTADDDLSPRAASPCIDWGGSPIPFPFTYDSDAGGAPRTIDIPGAPNRASISGLPVTDRGAYERQSRSNCASADLDASGRVGTGDLAVLLLYFGRTVPRWDNGDFSGDAVVNTADLQYLLVNFGCAYPD